MAPGATSSDGSSVRPSWARDAEDLKVVPVTSSPDTWRASAPRPT